MSISLAVSAPAPIPDLDTLKTEVANWLDRDDLADKIPMFVQMAEAEFNRELRTPEMELSTTFTVSDEDTPLPSDYLAMRSIYVEGSPDRPLRAMSPTAIREGRDGTAGDVFGYTLVAGGIRMVPPPSDDTALTMDYWAGLDALSVVAPSNWLLQKHPDAYLVGTLLFAEWYLDNMNRAALYRQQLDVIIDRINRSSRNDRYGAGPLVPNTTRQVGGRATC